MHYLQLIIANFVLHFKTLEATINKPMIFLQYLKQNISVCIGNIAEWYDLSLYVVFSSTMGLVFFPNLNPARQTELTMAIFALGIISRNAGAWFFGRLATRIAPETIYKIIVRLCLFSTLVIAILPTYKQVGVLAPISLLLVRMLQGFSSGAQYPGALTILYDSSDHPARSCSLAHITSLFGYCLAGIMFLVLQEVSNTQFFTDYGWRVAFASSLLLIIIIEKINPLQTKDFTGKLPTQTSNTKLQNLIKKNWEPFSIVIGLTTCAGIIYFSCFVFLQKILDNFSNLSQAEIISIQTVCWASSCCSVWLFSKLIKNNQFYKNIIYGCVAIIISALLAPKLIQINSLLSCSLISILLITANSLIISGIAPYFCAQFGAKSRFSVTAISYNIGTTASAIIATAIAMQNIKSHSIWNYSLLLIISAVITALITLLNRRSAKSKLA
jgi:MFS family permease